VEFLKELLELNNYTVVVVPSAPPKAAPPPKPAEGAEPIEEPPPPPTAFTIGVTDVTFNSTNAVFGRLLKTSDGRIVTLAYWQQKEAVANDQVPYFDNRV
jgi:hypothetical protein